MEKNKKAKTAINLIVIVILLGLFVFLSVYFYDDFRFLNTPEGAEAFIEKMRGTGFRGAAILVLIQTLQIVVAFIPGEFVELASGAMFGPYLGLLLCLIGLNAGTLIIFGLVKILGKPFVKENVDEKKYKHFRFLNDPDRALTVLFFIFLIPGIPKDVLIYPIPLTKVKMWKFMIVSSVARIPSIISSTFIGAAVLEKNFLTAGIIFGVFFVLGVVGLIFNRKIYEWIDAGFGKDKKD